MDAILLTLTVLSVAAAAGFAAAAWRTRIEQQQRSAARVAALASTLYSPDASGSATERPVPVLSIFDTISGPGIDGRRFSKRMIFTGLASAIVILGGMVLRSDPHPAAQQQIAPLELVSMRHARDGRTLKVTGLVRNPADGAPLVSVAALVFAFDRSGDFVASGRAALDLATLEPGDESPFVVTLTDLAEVGRYRVSFRTEAGPIRHVDRRAATPLVRVR
jgi:hypothetical protein